jgi:hypothetical protein
MAAPALVLQTVYSELLERCASAAFGDAFSSDGAFISKAVKGRTYWYFQSSSGGGRKQKYVGPETPELLKQIAEHKEIRKDEGERKQLVSTLIRSFGMARPVPEIGEIVAALAKAGVFRLRGVLVGTIAYQTYSGMLGVKLPSPALQTGDVDIAQFKTISIGVEDSTPPVLDVLKEVDKTFRPIPSLHKQKVATYEARSGLRVDFLTPTEGRDTDEPQLLPSFNTGALPLRFLDYLIHDPEPAVVLHGSGIYVSVPAPQRYAFHKLIVSRRRTGASGKSDKDLQQADALLRVLTKKRPYEIRSAWEEAIRRGSEWSKLIFEGMTFLSSITRDMTLKIVERQRNLLPGADLTFNNPPPRYDFSRDVLIFEGESLGSKVQCEISRESLDDYFKLRNASNETRVRKFLEKRSVFENAARMKYLSWPIEEAGSVLVRTQDMPSLLHEMSTKSKAGN